MDNRDIQTPLGGGGATLVLNSRVTHLMTTHNIMMVMVLYVILANGSQILVEHVLVHVANFVDPILFRRNFVL